MVLVQIDKEEVEKPKLSKKERKALLGISVRKRQRKKVEVTV